jgi:DNA-binding IclR family transcriptional regulator
MARDPPQIGSVAISCTLLDFLQRTDSASVTALADELDLSKGTVWKHLQTLQSFGYVRQIGTEYTLGLGCLGLGARVRTDSIDLELIEPLLAELASATNCDVYLFGLSAPWLVCISTAGEGTTVDVGDRFAPVDLASGMVMLAAMDEGRRGSLVSTLDDEGVQWEDLESSLDRIRSEGSLLTVSSPKADYAIAPCVAAPIGEEGSVTYGLSVEVGEGRSNLGRDIRGQVQGMAARIEAAIAND